MNIITISCIIIIVAGLAAAFTNTLKDKSVKKTADLIVEFGKEAIDIANDAIDNYSIDPTKYDTVDGFRQALSTKVAEALEENIKNRGEVSDIIVNKDLLYTVVDYIFKLYAKDLSIDQIYNDAKTAKTTQEAVTPVTTDTATKTTVSDTATSTDEIPDDIKAEFTDAAANTTIPAITDATIDTTKVASDLAKSESVQAAVDKAVATSTDTEKLTTDTASTTDIGAALKDITTTK